MPTICLSEDMIARFRALKGTTEVRDEAGRIVGYFLPGVTLAEYEDPPLSPEEIKRRRSETGGRTLEEIWKSLGAK